MSYEILSIPCAQQELGGVSRPTIYRLLKRGLLRRVKLGSRAFITRASVQEYLRSLGVEGLQQDPAGHGEAR